ncbi:hypothetical protein B0H14DRAFT_3853724 [Mycena olivaceomarginata]|nr:hypothetical protein B0H14DRAFT_3853724 [Mycena olivaceomarginata]
MKFISQTLVTLTLYTLASSAAPATSPANVFEKRAESCTITADGARCRHSASSTATILGQFAIGTSHTFACQFTASDGSGVWDRTTITLGSGTVNCFVSDSLVALPCPIGLPAC